MKVKLPSSALAPSLICVSALLCASASAQDNIFIFGNSIIDDDVSEYLSDIVVQSGQPAPNVVTDFGPDQNTSDYVASQGLISSSLPAGETWKAMIVQGGTVETTTLFGFDPALFHANMLTLAGTFFAHSPGGLFVGHETGADHPSSSRYPAWFPDAATWLGYSQVAYAGAEAAILAAHPANPAPRTAHQGTVFASTAGYPLNLFTNDEHHHSIRGRILDAILHYQTIYGGRLCDLPVDFGQSTPLVNRLMADGISIHQWRRLAAFADRSLPSNQREFPGSNSDLQLRLGINTGMVNLCTYHDATAGDTLQVRAFSPLGGFTAHTTSVYSQLVPTGSTPAATMVPGLYLNQDQARLVVRFPDLTGGAFTTAIPTGLAGNSLWFQAISRSPAGTPPNEIALTDAKVITLQ